MNHELGRLFRLDGKVVLVTGASSGLGLHFAGVLARAGAAVAMAARRRERVAEAAAALARSGARALAVALDVTSAASVRSCFDEVTQALGMPDVVVNNAGVTVTKPLLQQDEADWDQVLDTNLKGNWLVATEAARRLAAAGRPGSIVNIASILGQRVAAGVAPYAISKAGVLQATRVMALELARHGIRVNALLPGYVVTDLNREFLESEAGDRLRSRIPSRRFAQACDLDGPLLLLASEAGAAMNGAALTVDHGHSVSSL
jgi:NAD(P)-dependent dehydrogenase (short-subunit alcohol dehydrogenase family)